MQVTAPRHNPACRTRNVCNNVALKAWLKVDHLNHRTWHDPLSKIKDKKGPRGPEDKGIAYCRSRGLKTWLRDVP